MSLDGNLTGGQIQEILDFFLYKAMEPLILNTDIFDIQVIYILSVHSRNKKRKLLSLKERDSTLLVSYLVSTERVKKLEILKSLHMERGFLYLFLLRVLDHMEYYSCVYEDHLVEKNKHTKERFNRKLHAFLQLTKFDSVERAFVVQAQTIAFLNLFFLYRKEVVSSYLKHVYKQARTYISNNNLSYDISDVVQNFLLAVVKAVDKYDSGKGALTSYINYWILNAQTCSNSTHEYGIAYMIPHSRKRDIVQKKRCDYNFSTSLDNSSDGSLSVLSTLHNGQTAEKEIEEDQNVVVLQKLIKKSDPDGLARLYLDIDETFFLHEKRLMLKSMKDEYVRVFEDSLRKHLKQIRVNR